MIVCSYVDDLLITSNDEKEIEQFKAVMKRVCISLEWSSFKPENECLCIRGNMPAIFSTVLVRRIVTV